MLSQGNILKKHASEFKTLNRPCSKTSSHDWKNLPRKTLFSTEVHTSVNSNKRNFGQKLLWLTMSGIQILSQISNNQLQSNSKANAYGLGRLQNSKYFLPKRNYLLKCLYEAQEQVSLKLTAPNQTLMPFLEVGDQDPSFHIPNIPKENVWWKDPNKPMSGRPKESQ